MIRSLMSRLGPMALVLAVGLAATTGPAAAQATGNVRGAVVDATTQRPLSGAQVVIEGTGRGGLTNAGGQFLLLNVPVGSHTLRVEMLGFASATQQITVQPGQGERIVVGLRPVAIAMDELVVTGTAGATSKRTLGNSITKVDAAQITQQTAVTNLTELLQAKTPGLQILTNSGTVGTASDIRIRGASSLNLTPPVVFIDGIRYNIDELGSFTPSGAGATSYSGQTTSAFNFINPNDIESVEVIKGPAAATLYGAEAANGVIQIITKKGKRGEQAMQWTVRSEYAQNEWALPIPQNYTTCDQPKIDAKDAAGNSLWPGCQGLAVGTILTDSPLERDPAALRTGEVRRMSLSARGGGSNFSYYFAGDINEENGVFHNNYSDLNSVRANFSVNPSEKLDVQVNTSYARGDIRLPVGDEAAQGMLLSGFRGLPGRLTSNPLNAGWAFTRAEQANDYNNTTRSDRLTLGTTVNLTPLQWFRNRLTLGMDYTSSLAQILSPPGSTDAAYAGQPGGFVAQRVPRNYVYTADYAGIVDRPLTDDLMSTTSFGVQAVAKKYEAIYASGSGLGAPDVTLISAATTVSGSNSFSEAKSLGYYVQEQLGWKNRLFVTAAVRADDNSAFGEDFDWIYYPKASLSWMLSEEPALQGLLNAAKVNNFKLRTAWGEAGQAPAPFSATQSFTIDRAVYADGTIGPALRTRSFGNPKLKAEHGTEVEVGFDAGLFDDRVGVEFTYYNKQMKDVIVSASAAGSSGFASTFFGFNSAVLSNLGQTKNSGVELAVSATPVLTPKFAWDTWISLATNANELVDFGDDRIDMVLPGQSYGSVQRHREGYPLAGYWFYMPVRDADGKPITCKFAAGKCTPDPTGSIILVGDTMEYIGPSAPTREVSFSNTFTVLRDFRVFVLFDYKGGHYLFNYKEYGRCRFQKNCERVNDPAQAEAVDYPIWAGGAARTSGEAGASVATATLGYWVEPADFVKLRDVSLTYTLPADVARLARAASASVTLAGHNLAQWTDYSGIDPEVSGYGNRAFGRADVYPVPMLRRLSASVNLSF